MTREKEIQNEATNYGYYVAGGSPERIYASRDFEQGALWADNHPYRCWKKYADEKPKEGVEVIAYNKAWINEDFNPNGTRVGFLNGDGEFTSAYWWDYQDCYETINKSRCEDNKEFYSRHIDNTEPEFWLPIPKYSYK